MISSIVSQSLLENKWRTLGLMLTESLEGEDNKEKFLQALRDESYSVFWALNLRGMYKYLTFKSAFTNKSCGVYMCWTSTDNPKSPTRFTCRNGPKLSHPGSRASRCLQAVYLSLRGMKPKLINCSWLHAELARVSAPWSCHRYGGTVLQWDRRAALRWASPRAAEPGLRKRWQTPLPSIIWVCLQSSSALPLPSTAQLPGPLVEGGRTVRTPSPALEAATHLTYRCTVTAVHRFRARVQHFMACTIFHWSVTKRLQLGQ